jgi:hypothetical protein
VSNSTLRKIKLIAQVIAAVVTALIALSTLVPKIPAIREAVVAALTPYLGFLSPYARLAGVASTGIFVYLATVLYNQWQQRDALITSLENHLKLELHDVAGKKATLTQSVNVRADVDGVEVYRHRLAADGSHTVPVIKAEGYGSKQEGPFSEHGLECHDLRFQPPLSRGRTVWQTFECEFTDCFTSTNENLDHPIDYRENLIFMEILFPAGRPPKSASGHFMKGIIKTKIATITPDKRADGRMRVYWRVKNPEHGCAYRVEWEW